MFPRLLLVLAVVTNAQLLSAQGPETLKALGAYRLTMPTVRTLIAVGKAYEEEDGADDVEEAMKDPSQLSIDQFVAIIGRFPILKKAVAASGMPAREFATASLAFYWAMRSYAEDEAQKMTGQKQSGPPSHVPRENIELLRANQAEIKTLSGRS